MQRRVTTSSSATFIKTIMDIVKKINLLNQATFDSVKQSDIVKVIERFTKTGLKMLDGDFGYVFWRKKKGQAYQLIYQTPGITYKPNPPRKRGYNMLVAKTHRPYMGIVKKERFSKYDLTKYMQSIVIIPIAYRKNIYGNMVLCFKKKHVFTKEERNLTIALGNATAQALAINQFYSELEELVAKRTAQLKATNASLERDKAEDEAILTSIGQGLIATDRQGEIIFINPQVEQMLGWKEDDILHKNIFQFLPLLTQSGQTLPEEERPIHQSLTQGKKVTSRNYYYIGKSGKMIPLSITSSPVKLNGEIIGAIEVFRDITQEKEIDQAKSELISLVSHQLRTPLSGINWYVESLIKEEVGHLNPEQKKYLSEVYRANQKLVELVYDFLNVSRIELGTFNIKLSAINIHSVCQGVLDELQPVIKNKHLKVKTRYTGNRNIFQADHKVITIVMQNLITNAVKYTRPNGNIDILIKIKLKDKISAILSIIVSDNGIGIPQKDQEKIFSKLFRADNIKTLDADGTGLGLYIVKSFIELCGGTIRFRSRENHGTKFYVDIPVSPSGNGKTA